MGRGGGGGFVVDDDWGGALSATVWEVVINPLPNQIFDGKKFAPERWEVYLDLVRICPALRPPGKLAQSSMVCLNNGRTSEGGKMACLGLKMAMGANKGRRSREFQRTMEERGSRAKLPR